MNLILPIGVGALVYFLSKKSDPSVAAVEAALEDPRATLSGPTGSQASVNTGAPPVTVAAAPCGGGCGGGASTAAVAAAPTRSQTVPVAGTRKTTGSRSLTQTLTPKRPVVNLGGSQETQTSIRAAIGGVAPDIVF